MYYNDINPTDTDFPEYGRQCELRFRWYGYHRATVVGRTDTQLVIEFSSGERLTVYRDEIDID